MSEKHGTIGLFLCRCGTNIADAMDLAAIEQWAREEMGVSFVESHDLLCSPAGKQAFEQVLTKKSAEAVVIAACSPKMHEKTFRDVAEQAGKNMASVHMANIREHVGWVTTDKGEATEKAKSLIAAGLNRTHRHEALERRSMECRTDVVIIGGGIAGIEAALTAAQAGRKVTLVEREISLGGSVIKTEEVAPNMECAPCVLAPRLSAVRDNPNITVVTNAEVTEVVGFLGNFTVRARKKARYVNDSCIGCEACFEACPVSVDSDFHLGLGTRKAIYTAFPGSLPAAAVIDRDACKHFADGSCDACASACPFQSVNFDDQDAMVEVQAGAIIVATGHANAENKAIQALGHGTIDNVYTMPEFERIASSNGPYGGEILMKNGQAPQSLAVIHCAGSLHEDGLDYCSGVCCMNAAKAGALARHKLPDITVHNLHDRLVFNGPDAQAFYDKQKEAGTHFVPVPRLDALQVASRDGKIAVSGEGMEPLLVDMLVLSTGMIPGKDTEELAGQMALELTKEGFFKPAHPILQETGASLDGIYVAGSCASPCSIPTAITRAQAAVGDILAKLVPGKEIELEVMTAAIDEEVCGGCRMCIAVCPYKAIAFDGEKKVSVINEAVCRGCGTCAATCPSGAATAKHFTDSQIYAELGGVLNG